MARTEVPNYNLAIDPEADLVELRDTLIEWLQEAMGDMDKAGGADDYAYYQGKVEVLGNVLTYLTDADQPLEVDGADAEHSIGKILEALPRSYRHHVQRVAKRLSYLEESKEIVAEFAGRPAGYRRGNGR